MLLGNDKQLVVLCVNRKIKGTVLFFYESLFENYARKYDQVEAPTSF